MSIPWVREDDPDVDLRARPICAGPVLGVRLSFAKFWHYCAHPLCGAV